MKKISVTGLVLGVILGLVAVWISGSWILWLGVGLAIGVMLGSAITRRSLLQNAGIRGELKS